MSLCLVLKMSPWWVLGLTILHQFSGVFWYSPWLFGYKWMRLNQLTPADIDAGNGMPFVFSVLMSLSLIYFLAWLFERLAVRSLMQGMWFAVACWLIFLAVPGITHAVFSRHSLVLLCVDLGWDLWVFLSTALVLVFYRRWRERVV